MVLERGELVSELEASQQERKWRRNRGEGSRFLDLLVRSIVLDAEDSVVVFACHFDSFGTKEKAKERNLRLVEMTENARIF